MRSREQRNRVVFPGLKSETWGTQFRFRERLVQR
jgi:hypothetical protein